MYVHSCCCMYFVEWSFLFKLVLLFFSNIWARLKLENEKGFSLFPPVSGLAQPLSSPPRGPHFPFPFLLRPSQGPRGPPRGPEGQSAPAPPPSCLSSWRPGPALQRHCQVGPPCQAHLQPRVRAGHEPHLNRARVSRDAVWISPDCCPLNIAPKLR